jgi:hypothetical protein
VRGKYSAENKQYIIDILNGMTADEQEFAYDLIHSMSASGRWWTAPKGTANSTAIKCYQNFF